MTINVQLHDGNGFIEDIFSKSKSSYFQKEKDDKTNGIGQHEENGENDRLARIQKKIDAGQELSQSDLDYLKEKDPGLYEEVMDAKRQADRLKQQLSTCGTKEEANAVIGTSSISVSQAAKQKSSGSADAGSTGNYKMKLLLKTTAEYIQSRTYKELPLKEAGDTENKGVISQEEEEPLAKLLYDRCQKSAKKELA